MIHIFDTAIAKEHGVNEAILLHNLSYWQSRNRLNNKNFFNGKYWTYNTTKAFTGIFEYWSESQIKRILKRLEDKELIISSNFNKLGFDRTKWYSVCQNCQMHSTESSNATDGIVQPIPDSKHINKHNKDISKDTSKNNSDNALFPVSNEKFNKQFCLDYQQDLIPLQLFLDWINYRWSIKRPYKTIRGLKAFLKKLESMENREMMVNTAMDREYTDIHAIALTETAPEGKKSDKDIDWLAQERGIDYSTLKTVIEEFDEKFHLLHNSYKPGRKETLETDKQFFVNSCLCDEIFYPDIITKAVNSISALLAWEKTCKLMNSACKDSKLNFIPEWKTFKNWVTARGWELEPKTGEQVNTGKYLPLDAEYYAIQPVGMKDSEFFELSDDHPGVE